MGKIKRKSVNILFHFRKLNDLMNKNILIIMIMISLISTLYVFAKNPDWKYKTDDSVWEVSINNEGYVAAGSADHHIYLFNKSGDLLWKYETGDAVYSVSINQDGYVAASSYDEYVYLFNKSGDLIWRFKISDWGNFVMINQDGNVVVGSRSDHHVYFFNEQEDEDINTPIGALIFGILILILLMIKINRQRK